ncbi:hypothetical protein Tco_1137244, partial [Tanacetum coccineum]
MSSNSDDIQAAGSDTRPPMLDRTDYESWSQRIRLYCRGKENGLQILQSIDQGPFELGTTRNTLGTTLEGGVLLGPERPRTYDDLSSKLTKEDRESHLYDEFERFKMLPGENINEYYVGFHKLVNDMRNIRMTMPNIQLNSKFVNNMSPEWDRFVTAIKLNKECSRATESESESEPKRLQNSDYFKDKMLPMQAQELLFLAGEQANTFDADVVNQPLQDLALNENNILQADECDSFDSNVDNEPTTQSIFMANLSLVGPTNLQAGPSNASILSEVHILKNA